VTAVRARRRGRRGLLPRVRRASAAIAVVALGALIAIGPPGQAARAGTGYDQITGEGPTDSAVTASWTSGLLDDTNKPITSSPSGELAPNSDRASGSGPLSFMYNDFKNLKVTVSQTQDITQQGLTVSWTGGQPSIVSAGEAESNFLQLMECWGDSTDGPDPEDCEFGVLPTNSVNADIGLRTGWLCEAPASTTNPPPALGDNGGPLVGCDPEEAGNASHQAPCPGTDCDPTHSTFEIPFVPVPQPNGTPSSPVWGTDITQYFDKNSTNEVQQAVTSANGTGQLQFETLTATGAPALGCGALQSNGQPQNCWLVIVPRGTFEPNGFQVNTQSTSPNGFIQSSPLSASNWAMRIQVHLSYATVPAYCPIGVQERQTAGTQIITRAVDSWELALNKQASCSRIYGFSATAEPTSTQDLCDATASTVGLAFTTIPIGSEAARDGTVSNCPELPQILYAPVAISAVSFGFNINNGTGYVSTPVKMTPVLMAKALTQVYISDMPDYYPFTGNNPSFPGPAWVQSNPLNMSLDPQFEKLNPEVTPYTYSSGSVAPLLTEDRSALNQQVWQWIQTDPATDSWLDNGTKSGGNTANVDPDYKSLQLGKSPAIDSFPRAYSGTLQLKNGEDDNESGQEQDRDSIDMLPYVNSYDSAASTILTANDPSAGEWNDTNIPPDGVGEGWWNTNSEQLGKIFIWGISDTPDLAAFGLIDAALCNSSGSDCVTPSVASLTTALDSAKPDSAGLLQVNPADPGNGGYPLVEVTYAAVATNQSSAALNDYADLISYAAGAGQTAGVAPGDLPPGYLPLPQTLKNQAQTVVAELRADASTSGGAAGGSPAVPTAAASPGASPTPSSSPTSDFDVSAPSAVLASSSTPGQGLGAIRWALLVVVIAGAACAASGTVLRSARVPRWPRWVVRMVPRWLHRVVRS
jgi:hypothetical protein